MGLRVKIARIEYGLKQKDLAKRVGISAQYLMQIEQGKAKNPSIDVMTKIAEELDSSVGNLFFNEK